MSKARIASLDGLRAVSIALVLVGHTHRAAWHPRVLSPFWTVLGNASLGVSIFFVISGYLITSLLLREHERFGEISLRNFYLRRFFRIFPAFYTYIAFVALLGGIGWLAVTRADLISAATFTWDYSRLASSWALDHIWSLSVEEQFYLLWPSLLAILLKRNWKEQAAMVAGGIILAGPLSRILTHYWGGAFYASHSYYLLHTRLDTLMFGCLCALLEGSFGMEKIYRKAAKIIVIFPVFVFLVSPLLRWRFGDRYLFVFGYTAEGIGIALTILWLVRNGSSFFGRILNHPIAVHVGVLSYSLYLWQQLFLNEGNRSATARVPLDLVCVAAAAILSYYIVEQPMLRYKDRFQRLASAAVVRARPLVRSKVSA